MDIEFDPAKRDWTLRARGIDFADAPRVFAGLQFTATDRRTDYGEVRRQTIGMLEGRMVVIVWTSRRREGRKVRRIISMRKANAREEERFRKQLR